MSATNGGYGRDRPRFSSDDLRGIFARRDAGEGVASIARDLGCSPGAIYYHLARTGRHVPVKDRYVARPVTGSGSCIRCGIVMGLPGMCLDCLEVEGVVAS